MIINFARVFLAVRKIFNRKSSLRDIYIESKADKRKMCTRTRECEFPACKKNVCTFTLHLVYSNACNASSLSYGRHKASSISKSNFCQISISKMPKETPSSSASPRDL